MASTTRCRRGEIAREVRGLEGEQRVVDAAGGSRPSRWKPATDPLWWHPGQVIWSSRRAAPPASGRESRRSRRRRSRGARTARERAGWRGARARGAWPTAPSWRGTPRAGARSPRRGARFSGADGHARSRSRRAGWRQEPGDVRGVLEGERRAAPGAGVPAEGAEHVLAFLRGPGRTVEGHGRSQVHHELREVRAIGERPGRAGPRAR